MKKYKTYVGADLHRTFTQFNAQTALGKEVGCGKVMNDAELLGAFLSRLAQPVQVAVEASGNAAWFHDTLSAQGYSVLIAHPRETRARSGTRNKNDRFDARMLATLLRGGLIEKQAWCPTPEVRDVRLRLRHMHMMRKTCTSYKNKIHSILIQQNYHRPCQDLFCKKGRAFLAALPLPEHARLTVDRSLGTIDDIEATLAQDIALCEELVATDEQCWRLTTIPGINVHLAPLIRYETDSIERFATASAYVNYTGLVPGREQSANRSREIGITKEGSHWLRWAYVQAAQTANRTQGRLNRFYWRHFTKSGNRGTAIVATAREIATIAYYMMSRRQGYYEPLAPSQTRRPA